MKNDGWLDELYVILRKCTIQLRKGEEVTSKTLEFDNGRKLEVTDVWAMPHTDDVRADADLELIDVHFMVIGVDRGKAKENEVALREALTHYPEQERLKGGPSYIEVGAAIGDQGAAFQLFALGKYLGFWDIITPESLGIKGEDAQQLAGVGLIMISGYNPTEKVGTHESK